MIYLGIANAVLSALILYMQYQCIKKVDELTATLNDFTRCMTRKVEKNTESAAKAIGLRYEPIKHGIFLRVSKEA